MLEGRKEKKEHLEEVNCWGNLWQKSYLDSQIKGTMRNTGQGQRGIGDNRKEKEQENKEQQKQ